MRSHAWQVRGYTWRELPGLSDWQVGPGTTSFARARGDAPVPSWAPAWVIWRRPGAEEAHQSLPSWAGGRVHEPGRRQVVSRTMDEQDFIGEIAKCLKWLVGGKPRPCGVGAQV